MIDNCYIEGFDSPASSVIVTWVVTPQTYSSRNDSGVVLKREMLRILPSTISANQGLKSLIRCNDFGMPLKYWGKWVRHPYLSLNYHKQTI